jgi:co-chaperonin GroES (HSP10)
MKILHPLSDRITIDAPSADTEVIDLLGHKAIGGIVVPQEFEAERAHKYKTAIALEVGPGCTTVKKGDEIVFFDDIVHTISMKGGNHYFVHEAQVQGVLREAATHGVPPATIGAACAIASGGL